ncbi:MAG: hypothetical protein M1492_15030 [Gammaproteobacteria bacterium]|nr:hypothetical protein [Gammaproteobacteria bacterium]
MERNAADKQVAQHYAVGIYALGRAPTDTVIQDDMLFMFLMGEAIKGRIRPSVWSFG